MKRDRGTVPLKLTLAALATGAVWTVVAGTLWQWLPIGAAIAVVYGAARLYEGGDAGGTSKPAKKPPRPKGKSKKCC